LVHIDFNAVPDDLVAVRIEVPDGLPVHTLRAQDLPEDWSRESGRPALQRMGATWLQEASEPVLLVPSVVVPEEANVLINPLHPDMPRIAIIHRSPFPLDPRLFKR
jgi:RES domain-containing protein